MCASLASILRLMPNRLLSLGRYEDVCPELVCDQLCPHGRSTNVTSGCPVCTCVPECGLGSGDGLSDPECDGDTNLFCRSCGQWSDVLQLWIPGTSPSTCRPKLRIGERCHGRGVSCPGECGGDLVCKPIPGIVSGAQACCPDTSTCTPCAAPFFQSTYDQHGCPTCECAAVELGSDHCSLDANCITARCDSLSGKCERCSNGRYLHDGSCVDVCPAGLVGWGEKQSGRSCVPPFTCRAIDGCTCPLGGCQSCDVGVDGTTCTLCIAERYLAAGKCQKELTCRGKAVRWMRRPAVAVQAVLAGTSKPAHQLRACLHACTS